jgi:hypothetical protein
MSLELGATLAPSLIPLAHTSVLPFLSLPPALLRERTRAAFENTQIYGLIFRPEASKDKVELDHKESWEVKSTVTPRWVLSPSPPRNRGHSRKEENNG